MATSEELLLRRPMSLYVESKLDDVAVGHDVVLALDAGLAGGAGGGNGAEGDEVVVRDDFGLDEALLEVRVDDAGGLGGRGALADRPGAGLLRACREVALQAEGLEADAREHVQAGLGDTGVGEELRRLVRLEVHEV